MKKISKLFFGLAFIAGIFLGNHTTFCKNDSNVLLDNISAIALADGEVEVGCICAYVNYRVCCGPYPTSDTSNMTQLGIRM